MKNGDGDRVRIDNPLILYCNAATERIREMEKKPASELTDQEQFDLALHSGVPIDHLEEDPITGSVTVHLKPIKIIDSDTRAKVIAMREFYK